MEPIPYEIMANAFMVIFAALGVFLTIYNVIKAARDLKKPHDDHMAQVSSHQAEIERIGTKLTEMQSEIHMMLDGHILVLEHIITGNHVDKLQEHKAIIVRYLINHRGNSNDQAAS